MPFQGKPVSTNPQTFGERLAWCRYQRHHSVRGLAAAIGINRNMLIAYEANRVSPTLSTVYALAQTLGVTVACLVGEEPLPCLCQPAPAVKTAV